MDARLTSPTARPISRRLAGVVAELELMAPETVTRNEIAAALEATGESAPDRGQIDAIIDSLRRYGWLLPLRTRGVWEFAPANRSGAFRSGDPFTELRAALAAHPTMRAAIAMESAAFRRGLAQHPPEPDVLVVPKATRAVGALRAYRLVRLDLPPTATTIEDDVPMHTVAALLASMAWQPRGYGDWPNVATWLPNAAARLAAASPPPEDAGITGTHGLLGLLARASHAAWARAAYLLRTGDQPAAATAVLAAAPASSSGPVYLGPRDRRGRYDRATGVYDSLIVS
jgi:AbiEi antitoxin C-terminal domain